MNGRVVLSIVLGAVMAGLGLLIIARLIVRGGEPMSPSIWLDLLFALFFLFRGGTHLRWSTRARRRPLD